jgi:hypothetical protein
MLDGEFTVNKYQVSQNGNGLCSAYVYCYYTDTDTYALPTLYTNVNNKPYKRKSINEKNIKIDIYAGNPAGWRNNTINLDGNINAGDFVWFGLGACYFTTRFDYGGECYKGWFDFDGYEEYDDGEPPPYINPTLKWVTYCTIKWSMYFTYTAVTSQNYTRTLAQGVALSDSRKTATGYKRDVTQIAGVISLLQKYKSIFLRLQENVFSTSILKSTKTFIRSIWNTTNIKTEVIRSRIFARIISETVKTTGTVFRGLVLYVKIFTQLHVRDFVLSRFLKAREEIVLKSRICREIELDSRIS